MYGSFGAVLTAVESGDDKSLLVAIAAYQDRLHEITRMRARLRRWREGIPWEVGRGL